MYGSLDIMSAVTTAAGEEDESTDVTSVKMKRCTATLLQILGFAVQEVAEDESMHAEGAVAAGSADLKQPDQADSHAEEDLAYICQRMEQMDANLPEFEPPPTLRCTLR